MHRRTVSHRPRRPDPSSEPAASFRTRLGRIAFYARLIRGEHRGGKRLGTGATTRALKFVLRSVIKWSATTGWLAFIDGTSLVAAPDAVKKVLAEKIHRPYARAHYGVADRAALLMSHYRILARRMAPERLADLVAGSRIALARLAGRSDDERFTIWLARKKNFAAQGELSVSFDDDRLGRPLSTLAANVFVDEQGAVVFYISGLQGPAPPFGRPEIVRATRSLSGLWPKRAVMEAARLLALWLGADVIVAVGRANHVTATGGRRGRDIRAEYDEFWPEFGGGCGPDGDFRLPSVWPRRTPKEVASKHRAAWRRRHDHIDDIVAQTREALARLEIGQGRVMPAPAEQDPAANAGAPQAVAAQ